MPVTSDAFRRALGSFTTGVCVVTCPPPQPNAAPVGLTVSSFASVSLDPPLVLWCIDKASDRFDPFHTAPAYAVSVLSEGQDGVSVAYAGEGCPAGVDLVPGHLGAPLINGAMAHLECRIAARHDAGDHVILVGQVQEITVHEDRAPLVYHKGRYRRLASSPDPLA